MKCNPYHTLVAPKNIHTHGPLNATAHVEATLQLGLPRPAMTWHGTTCTAERAAGDEAADGRGIWPKPTHVQWKIRIPSKSEQLLYFSIFFSENLFSLFVIVVLGVIQVASCVHYVYGTDLPLSSCLGWPWVYFTVSNFFGVWLAHDALNLWTQQESQIS